MSERPSWDDLKAAMPTGEEVAATIPDLGTPTAPGAAASGFLTRDQILSKDDIVYETIDVPEWGGKLLVKSLNGRERAHWQQASVKGYGPKTELNYQAFNLKLIQLSVIDPETKRPLFSDNDLKDLGRKSSAAIERVAECAMRLSGIGEAEVKEVEKNWLSSLEEN